MWLTNMTSPQDSHTQNTQALLRSQSPSFWSRKAFSNHLLSQPLHKRAQFESVLLSTLLILCIVYDYIVSWLCLCLAFLILTLPSPTAFELFASFLFLLNFLMWNCVLTVFHYLRHESKPLIKKWSTKTQILIMRMDSSNQEYFWTLLHTRLLFYFNVGSGVWLKASRINLTWISKSTCKHIASQSGEGSCWLWLYKCVHIQ